MTEAEKRLAKFVADWAKAEIELGYKVHPVQSKYAYEIFSPAPQDVCSSRTQHAFFAYCCGGEHKRGTQMTGYQATIEACGRHLVWQVRAAAQASGAFPHTHQIMWRDLPAIDEEAWLNEYLPSLNAYCRIAFIPLDAGERVPSSEG